MVKRLKVEIYTSNVFGNEVKLADLNLLNVNYVSSWISA